MKNQSNEEIKKQFERDFKNARKMYEAEQKQNPFGALAFIRNGQIIHKIGICWN